MRLPGAGSGNISPFPLVLLHPMKEKPRRCLEAGIHFTELQPSVQCVSVSDTAMGYLCHRGGKQLFPGCDSPSWLAWDVSLRVKQLEPHKRLLCPAGSTVCSLDRQLPGQNLPCGALGWAGSCPGSCYYTLCSMSRSRAAFAGLHFPALASPGALRGELGWE